MLLAASRFLFAASLLATPWMLGGAEDYLTPWFVWPLVAGLLLGAAHAVRDRRRPTTRVWRLMIPVLLGATLGMVQLAPLFGPGGIASSAADLRAELSAEQSSGPSIHTLGPAATRRQVAWLLIAAATLWQAGALFAEPASRRRLMAALAANGAALSVVSIVQAASWNGRIYWIGPEVAAGPPPVGPFVYHNQAGAYFATCAACLCGWFLATDASVPKLIQQVRALQYVVGLCLLGGLLASYSRGALLAVIATLVVMLPITRRRINFRLASAAAALVSAVLVGALVLSFSTQRTTDRLAALADEQLYGQDGRLDHWPVAIRAATEFWGLGAGLGAYKQVNPLFETEPATRIYERAHNQYLEAIVEGGLVALALVLVAIAIAAVHFYRTSQSVDLTKAAIGAAALAALLFQVLHGVVDFCLYLPANLLLFAAVAGLGMSCRATSSDASNDPSERANPAPRWAGPLATTCLAAAALWSAVVLHRHAQVDGAIKSLPWLADDASLQVSQAERLVEQLQSAKEAGSDNAQAWQALGEALLLRYRLMARDSISEDFDIPADDPELWALTQPSRLLNVAATFRSQGDEEQLAELRQQEVVVANLPAARTAFRSAASHSPLMPKPRMRLLALSWLDDKAADIAGTVDRVMRLAPMRADRLFEVGSLAFFAGEYESIAEPWRRCLQIDSDYAEQVIPLASLVMPADKVVTDLLPADPAALFHIYSQILGEEQRERLGAPLVERALALLLSSSDDETPANEFDAESWRLLGRLHAAAGQVEESVEAYRNAVARRPTELDWRIELALQLVQLGRPDEARKEVVFCVRLAPQTPRYVSLLERLKREAPAE